MRKSVGLGMVAQGNSTLGLDVRSPSGDLEVLYSLRPAENLACQRIDD